MARRLLWLASMDDSERWTIPLQIAVLTTMFVGFIMVIVVVMLN